MIYKKILYYRKKRMMTQEQLADELHVSRQTITKWESGLAIPSLEYLIDLAELFSITLDTLVKKDDCQTKESKNQNNVDEVTEFLIKAKKQTYAAKKGKIDSTRKDATDYTFTEGDYTYIDSFVGSSKFAGEEIVYNKDTAVWSMNYYGIVLHEDFNGDFLKKALLEVPDEMPYRGPALFVTGDYIYYNDVELHECYFSGKEVIFYLNHKVYEGVYHGGFLE